MRYPLHWCGPVCAPKYDQLYRYNHSGEFTFRFSIRVWEALRYHVVEELAEKAFSLSRLGIVWERLPFQQHPLSLLRAAPLEVVAKECPLGGFVLKLASAFSLANHVGSLSCLSKDVQKIVLAMIDEPGLMEAATCSGWPIFGIFRSMTNFNCNMFGDLRPSHISRLDASRQAPLWNRLFSSLRTCARLTSLGTCLRDFDIQLKEAHDWQSDAIFGLNTCPPGCTLAWLDRMGTEMRPVPAFPLCTRRGSDVVSATIKQLGMWRECVELSTFLLLMNLPGYMVVDVGANIGACTMVLALLGYHVLAFEPVDSNADILEASLRINGVSRIPAIVWDGGVATGGSYNGSVTVQRKAVGSEQGFGQMVQSRHNIGDNFEVSGSQKRACDISTHRCNEPFTVPVVSLDDLFLPYNLRIGIVKIDVQGGELGVLLGAQRLLQKRAIGGLYFEWSPLAQSSTSLNNSMAILQLLSSLDYNIMAPSAWIKQGQKVQKHPWHHVGLKEGGAWHKVTEHDFADLQHHSGNLVAFQS